MPYTTLVAGTTITAAWANANVRDQTVSPFASTAARDSAVTVPVAGMVHYLTTNASDEGLTTRTSAGTWRAPWNLPWGRVGAASTTTSTSGTTSAGIDWPSLTVTWTAIANRIYRISAIGLLQSTIVADGMQLLITDNTPTTKQASLQFASVASNGQSAPCTVDETGLSGSQTRKVRIGRFTGTGTVTGAASGAAPAQITVDDMGPSGAPS